MTIRESLNLRGVVRPIEESLAPCHEEPIWMKVNAAQFSMCWCISISVEVNIVKFCYDQQLN